MQHSRFSPDDPKLTAYALGELQGEERAAVEAALRDDPAARAFVEQTQAFAAQLEAALVHEPEPESAPAPNGNVVPEVAHVGIIPGTDPSKLEGGPLNGSALAHPKPRSKLLQFPQLYFVIGSLAAACFAVLLAFRTEKPAEKKVYYEVLLNPKTSTADAGAVDAASKTSVTVRPVTTAGDPVPAAGAGGGVVPQPDKAAVAAVFEPAPLGPKSLSEITAPPIRKPEVRLEEQARNRIDGSAFSGQRASALGTVAYSGAALPIIGGASTMTTGRLASPSVAQRQVQRTAFKAPAHSPVYTYPPDKGFVAPVQPRSYGLADVAPRSSQPRNWSFAPPPSSFGPLAKEFEAPFDQRLDFSLRAGTPNAPFGPLDLLPGPASRQNRPFHTESYAYLRDNPFVTAAESPFSTFAVDVDTASYSNVRRFIDTGLLPPEDAVRIEELLNYFPYHYTAPEAVADAAKTGERAPIAASLEVADAPWAPTHRLVRVGLKARDVAAASRPPANLVFLLDVSGSMGEPKKLPLVKEALHTLVDALRPDDHVAIVTYAGTSGLALPSTPAARSREILDTVDSLHAGGSTNGGMGIQLAYDIAKANFIPSGINRVILCTDGDFNVGVTSEGELTRLIEEKAQSGVALTALGFGMGNYKDSMLEQLADKGKGNYGYIDNREEAGKLLAQQVNGTLMTVAKNVKVQVDFNPARVASYRLIGYEDRLLQAQDFNNDAADAGQMGAGHAVTALYEIVPVGVEPPSVNPPAVDVSHYASTATPAASLAAISSDELLTVKVRYQDVTGGASRKLEFPLKEAGESFANASSDFKFAAAVAEFGMLLRKSPYRGSGTLGDVIAWAAAAAAKSADDPGGCRGEFIDLARRTQALMR